MLGRRSSYVRRRESEERLPPTRKGLGMAASDAEELLALARAIGAEDPVCASCVGRLIADRSFGLVNAERGRALRIMEAMVADTPYEPPADADCWVCEGESTRAEWWAEQVVEALDGIDFETYQVGCRVPPLLEENDRLFRESVEVDPEAGEPLKRDLNREVGKRVGEMTDTMVDFERADVVALLHLERDTVEVRINPAFVYGRYRKLERDIPQTEWPCRDCGSEGIQLGPDGPEPCEGCDGTGYRYDQSVEGFTAPVVAAAMGGEEGVFHGAGREDVDARMLGTGRPFVIEVKEPTQRTPDLDAIETSINTEGNGAVEVEGLTFASHEMVERVKGLDASKTYRATVAFDDRVSADDLNAAIDELDGTTVEQYTPNRVDHRRASLTRERTVYNIEATLEDPTTATVELHGEGGLYVKELISGDDGRTEPSLAGLLDVNATVDALDVLAVEGEEEPFAIDAMLV